MQKKCIKVAVESADWTTGQLPLLTLLELLRN